MRRGAITATAPCHVAYRSAPKFGTTSPMIRHAQRLLLLLGIALCVLLVAHVGVAQIWRDLSLMGWSLLGIVLLEFGVDVLNTIGWRYTFPIEERRIPFGSLFLARLAGTAFNQVLPAASVGGEPIKALLLR